MENEKVFAMSVGKVYPLPTAKAQRKGRTRREVDAVTCWLTGYTPEQLEEALGRDMSYREFFNAAPLPAPERRQDHGSVCGVRVQGSKAP